MTNEEALELLHKWGDEGKIVSPQAVEFAIVVDSALRKQIPRKPIVKTTENQWWLKQYYCPCCHKRLRTRNQKGLPLKEKGKLCDACGQRLDFGDKE